MNTELNASHGTVEGKKEKLVEDLKGVVGDADDLTTAAELAAARTTIEGKLGEAKSRLDDARIAITEKARGAADTTQEYVRENPWKVLGVATAVGIIIGFLLSNRR